MSNKETTNCGSIEILNKLRQSQEIENPKKENIKNSRLEKYLAKGIQDKKENKTETIASSLSSIDVDHNKNYSVIHEIDPDIIHRWSGKDRPENELGDIEDLAKGFKTIGQQVPCIIRPHKSLNGQYELIVGECRWRASKLAKIKLKAVIQDIDDRMASLIQAVENEKRNNLSDFAKGMSYAKKIESGLLKQKDLIEILGISKQQVSRLLSFNKIPKPLFNAIKDFRKVSARTAEELSRLSAKGDNYIDALIDLAPKIETGKFGGNRVIKEVDKIINPSEAIIHSNKKIFDIDGRHLFTWRLDNNSSPSIHFPKDIIKLINSEDINLNHITQEFKLCLAKKLSALKESPHVGTKK